MAPTIKKRSIGRRLASSDRIVKTLAFWIAVVHVGCGHVLTDEELGSGDGAGSCANGSCECTADTTCSDHEICAAGVCTCAPAYVNTGIGCTFDSAPHDTGFSDPSAWTVSGPGVTVDASATGIVNAGQAEFDVDGMCQFSSLSQIFEMPPLARAQPLKLVVTTTGVDPGFDLFAPRVQIGIGGEFFDIDPPRNAYRTDSFCLGPRAYGGSVEFRIGTFGGPGCGTVTTAMIAVDALTIVPAAPGECPVPGTISDGNFEGPATAWTFATVQGATGAIVPGIGEAGSAAAQLTTTTRCSEVTMTGAVAFPTAAEMPDQAIDLFWSGPTGKQLAVSIDGNNIAELVSPSMTGHHSHVCVPAWATGTSAPLGMFLQRIADQSCTPLAQTFTIDSLSIVSDPACAGTGDLTDPGFERVANLAGPAPGWGLVDFIVNDGAASSAGIFNAPASAHTGNGVLALVSSDPCSLGGVSGTDLTLIVPAPQPHAGPAIKLFANVGADNVNSDTVVGLSPFRADQSAQILLPELGVYAPSTLCLPAALAGRRVTVHFSTSDTDGGACGSYPPEMALIDDLQITTDAGCAAQ